MAADIHKDVKEKTVRAGGLLNKQNVYGRIYGKVQKASKDGKKLSTQTEWFFGLRRSEEKFVFDRLGEDGESIFHRTQKVSFNGLRTKISNYNESSGKKSEHRRYLGGLFKTAYEYDLDGRVTKSSFSDPVGTVTRSIKGRELYHEEKNFGGLHSSRQVALWSPDGDDVKWRTMERKIGPYSMKIKLDAVGNGETKTHVFGRLFGKKLFEHEVHYNFDTKKKTIHYKGFFRVRDKYVDLTDEELEKFEERKEREEAVLREWEKRTPEKVDTHREGTGIETRSSFVTGRSNVSSQLGANMSGSLPNEQQRQAGGFSNDHTAKNQEQRGPYIPNDTFGISAGPIAKNNESLPPQKPKTPAITSARLNESVKAMFAGANANGSEVDGDNVGVNGASATKAKPQLDGSSNVSATKDEAPRGLYKPSQLYGRAAGPPSTTDWFTMAPKADPEKEAKVAALLNKSVSEMFSNTDFFPGNTGKSLSSGISYHGGGNVVDMRKTQKGGSSEKPSLYVERDRSTDGISASSG
ncbi:MULTISPECIES: hypothetical protein [unclassified Ensifer]|uniref:hypothetical protein n=1 Tax=unclassified Ensifer TaxID=2633371 RepID=UPI0008132450|nr:MULTISPECIES: hypothetical protein [unclassified Ensifer]OCP23570.1 hypothetical protein BC363_24370 [Ensifer sp. LC384]OCP24257.1 hypothetical protein BC361_20850 [Ensifer sp. LC54]